MAEDQFKNTYTNRAARVRAVSIVFSTLFAVVQTVHACADCVMRPPDTTWWCVGDANTPYQYCRNWTPDLCLFAGSCPGGGGGRAKTLEVVEVWSLSSGATLNMSKQAVAANVDEVRAAVAKFAGVSVGAVHLRGSGFTYATGDLGYSRAEAILIEKSGFFVRTTSAGENVALTTCVFNKNESSLGFSSFVVKPGDVAIVSLPSATDQIVVSIRVEGRFGDEVVPMLESIQKAYKEQIAKILEPDLLTIAPGTAPVACGP
jgi:hypothetical protein